MDIRDGVLSKAKEVALRTHKPLRQVVEEALMESFDRAERQSTEQWVSLPVAKEPPGLCPGVDLDDSSALLDIMELRRGSA